ncbi:MAG: hypothetical protein ACLU0O_09170 [Collinsella sp.]
MLGEARIPVSERAGVPVVRTAPEVPWCGSPEFARTNVLNARRRRVWLICFAWLTRISLAPAVLCGVDGIPALMVRGLENIPVRC